MIEFNIGDRVRVKDYKEGVIVDKLYSEARSKFVYFICFDGDVKTFPTQFDGESLEPHTAGSGDLPPRIRLPRQRGCL